MLPSLSRLSHVVPVVGTMLPDGPEPEVECSVCTAPIRLYHPDTYARACSNGHIFHIECLGRWIKTAAGPSCPDCRGGILPGTSDRLLTLDPNRLRLPSEEQRALDERAGAYSDGMLMGRIQAQQEMERQEASEARARAREGEMLYHTERPEPTAYDDYDDDDDDYATPYYRIAGVPGSSPSPIPNAPLHFAPFYNDLSTLAPFAPLPDDHSRTASPFNRPFP